MKKIQIIVILILLHFCSYSQTDILLTQQMFSRMNFNPAATGIGAYTSIFCLSRMQWVGIEDAPRSQYLDIHQYVPKIRAGVGLSFIHDQIGLEQYDNLKAAYAHHIKLSPSDNLSLGISGGFEYHAVDKNKIYEQPDAPSNIYTYESKFFPDIDFGIEYEHKNFVFGFSMTHIVNQHLPANTLRPGMHTYGYVQYVYEAEQWTWNSSVTMTNSVNTFNFDLSLLGTYNRSFWIGSVLRSSEELSVSSISALIGIWLTPNWRLGYAYDFNINQLAGNKGSHEICIIYTMDYLKKDVASPRLFKNN